MAILRYFTISPANPFKIWAPATVCMVGNSPYPTDPTGVPGEFQRIYAQEKRRKPLSRSSMHFVIFSTVLVPCGSEIRMATLAGQTFLSALKSEVFSMEDDPEDADETVSCSIDRLLNICC